jgi:hypothetical protein
VTLAVSRVGTIFKKCDRSNPKPDSNQRCAASVCQHTCATPGRCAHTWTLRYWAGGKQVERSFKDTTHPASGRVGRHHLADIGLADHGPKLLPADFVFPKYEQVRFVADGGFNPGEHAVGPGRIGAAPKSLRRRDRLVVVGPVAGQHVEAEVSLRVPPD